MPRFYKQLFLTSVLLFIGFVVQAQPVANFSANVLTGCAPLVVNFTNSSTGNPTSYSWSLGNGATSTLQNPSTTYTLPGTYTVTLTVTNANGSNTKTITNYITVNPNPTVSFTANNLSGCPGTQVAFTNNSNPNLPGTATYLWSFGDGYISSIQNPVHTYTTPGYFTVSLTVINSQGCQKTLSDTAYIHIFTPPNGAFGWSPNNICSQPYTVTFTNTSTGTGTLTNEWLFGDGGSSFQNNPTHTYASPGSYMVSLITTDGNGCKDTTKHILSVTTLVPSFTTANGCVGTPISFTNTTPPPFTTLDWSFGDGGTGAGAIPTHIYNSPGTYHVLLTVHNGSCVDTVSQTVTIYPAPVAAFTASPLPPCPPPVAVNFTNNSTGASSYIWSFGDGGTSTANSPSHTYTNYTSAPYHDTVTLIAISSNGCRDTLVKPGYIQIYPILLTALSNGQHGTGGCAPLTVNFGSNYSYGSGATIATYQWTYGDGGNSTAPTPTHTYNNPGTYQAILTITTSNGCTKKDTIYIHVGIHPTASFTISPVNVCVHQHVLTVNNSTGATNYLWYWGDGTPGDTTFNGNHTYNTSGVYTVKLIAFNNGCPDSMVLTNVVTVNFPTSQFSYDYSCDTPKKITFTNNSLGATTYEWSFGDGATTTTQYNPVHIYAAFGSYQVRLITHNSASGCSDTLIQQVDVLNPLPNFTVNDSTLCKGAATAIFTSTSTGGNFTHFTWIMDGHLFPDTTASITYTFPDTGHFTIVLTVTDVHGCLRTVTKTNYVTVAHPVANFSATPLAGCGPLSVTFTDLTTNVSGVTTASSFWTWGDGLTGTSNPPTATHIYNQSGVFTVKVKVTDIYGCVDSITKQNYITVHKPYPTFFATDSLPCINTPVTFSLFYNLAGNTVKWYFGDGGTSTSAQPSHTYSQYGTYDVKVVVTDQYGCKDSLTKPAYIHISKPTAGFTMSDSFSVCPPLTVHFTNTSVGATHYEWNFSGGSSSILTNPTNVFTTVATDTIMLVAISAKGCRDTTYNHITIFGIVGGFTYSPMAGCAPLTVHFQANTTNVPTIIWDFSDGTTLTTSGTASATHTYTEAGAYIPKLVLSDGTGCQNSSTGLDTIKVMGAVANFWHSPACVGSLLQFHDSSKAYYATITGIHWTFDDGSTSDINNPTHFYPTVGTYPVSMIVSTDSGCVDTLHSSVTIHPLPTITSTPDTIVCLGDPAHLTGMGGSTYSWSPATGLSCTLCTTTLASPAANTLYTVTGTDAYGCVNSDTVRVTLKYKTTAVAGQGGAICPKDSIQISASGGTQYSWYPATGLNNNQIPNPKASPAQATQYMVVTKEGSCIADTDYVQVQVYASANIDAGQDVTIAQGESVKLHAQGNGIVKYVWDAQPNMSCTDCQDPTVSPVVTTQYKVTGTTANGCVDTGDVVVKVVCNENQVFVPNTFTPNGDGENDLFYPRSKGLSTVKSFRVYNRWGELMYEKKNIQFNDEGAAWDGRYNGTLLSPDVYVYMVETTCASGEALTIKGDVTLLR